MKGSTKENQKTGNARETRSAGEVTHTGNKKNRKNAGLQEPFFRIAALCNKILDGLSANGKRFACVLAVLLFFALSSSFSFPIFEEAEVLPAPDAYGREAQTAFIEEKEAVNIASRKEPPAADEVLDDADVLDGYEDAELEHMEDVDKYTSDEILEENDGASGEAAAGGAVSLETAVFDKSDWRLLLINKQHPIPEDYTFRLGTIKGTMKCDERILDDLLAMLQAAKEDGISLVICSPYRDLNRQKVLFERKVKAYMDKEMSYIEAYKISSQAVTVPGASEHQIGLALDIVCTTYYSLNEGYGETEAGQWLQEHSHEYGFTLRYPKGKEYITGIEYEPWHFRYVGKEAAAVMKEKGICLEELIDSL